MAVQVELRTAFPGPPRRRLQEGDMPTVRALERTQEDYLVAKQLRDGAVRAAFDRGIHYLDVQKAAGVAVRTARGWYKRYEAETAGNQGG